MSKIEFHRNHVTLRGTDLRRRSIILIFVVAFFVVFAFFVPKDTTNQKIEKTVIKIAFLENDKYLIQSDTTSYDDFASVLRKELDKIAVDKSVELLITIPKDRKVGEVSDIIQVASAFDGVKLTIN